ncbi:MAG: hypothetical protein IIZ93_09155 [Acidaminococcaceae bacterium]|nr:hypothetical protein [Acidaminococcaceae bacterium]
MNALTGYIIAAAILAISCGVTAVMAKICKELQAENFELKETLEKQQKTIADLLRYSEEVARISSDRGNVEEAIKSAKTDEDLVNIANAILSTNNDRVRK